MSTPRRRILRANRATTADADPRTQLQLHKRRTRLERDRASLAKWMTRLKRAFHAVEKQQHHHLRPRTPNSTRLEQLQGQTH